MTKIVMTRGSCAEIASRDLLCEMPMVPAPPWSPNCVAAWSLCITEVKSHRTRIKRDYCRRIRCHLSTIQHCCRNHSHHYLSSRYIWVSQMGHLSRFAKQWILYLAIFHSVRFKLREIEVFIRSWIYVSCNLLFNISDTRHY